MIQIFLDGLQAFIPEKTSIKFTSENPYFTKTTTYTYEIELPLSVAANRRIFGYIDRLDINKEERSMSARLIVDNRTMLVGTAHITSITDNSVKVQLLGSAASYNYGNKTAETYIDCLDLGDWFMTTWPDGSMWNSMSGQWDYDSGRRFRGSTAPVWARTLEQTGYGLLSGLIITEEQYDTHINNIFGDKYPWVAYPTVNSNADFLCNCPQYMEFHQDSGEFKFLIGVRPDDRPDTVWESGSEPVSLCVQPYLWIMAEKIAEATGLKLMREDNALYTDELFRKIFIVNANNYIECNKCLPHWSVGEWWDNIENAFGLILDIDSSSGRVRLIKRSEFYSDSEMVEVRDVLDEYTADMNDDTNHDISVSNTGFADFESSPFDLLDEAITENADFDDSFQDIDALHEWASKTGTIGMAGYKSTIFRCKDGRHFIYTTRSANGAPGFVEVDMFRPRMVNQDSDEVEIELKFVPARYVESDFKYFLRSSSQIAEKSGTFQALALQRPDIPDMSVSAVSGAASIDIEAVLNGDEEATEDDTSSVDVIYIAIADNSHREQVSMTIKNDSGKDSECVFSFPLPLLREQVIAPIDSGPQTLHEGAGLSLIPIAGQANLADRTLSDGITVNTRSRYCIRFIMTSMPDVSRIFNIHNRLFVCEKIEADITVAGLGKLFTGYFYELSL